MEKRKKYIAYGSNLNLEQMARRCPTAKVIGAGTKEGSQRSCSYLGDWTGG